MRVPVENLRWWNPATRTWALESGAYGVLVGGSSDSASQLKAVVAL
jgi:hypothetical protein